MVKVVNTKDDAGKLLPGEVMVAIGTDLDLMGAMRVAGGIITEEGGFLSHASVRSREMQIPCLIGVAGVTQAVRDGDRVLLDCEMGVARLEEAAPERTSKPLGLVCRWSDQEDDVRFGRKLLALEILDRSGVLVPQTLGVPDPRAADFRVDRLAQALLQHPRVRSWERLILRSSTSVEDAEDASYAGEFESPVKVPDPFCPQEPIRVPPRCHVCCLNEYPDIGEALPGWPFSFLPYRQRTEGP